MSGKHPRSNLPFAAPAVPQFRWQLTEGGPVPAPATAAAASRAPRGSAAAAKRRHARDPAAAASAARQTTGAPSGLVAPPPRPGTSSFASLQRAWLQPDFVNRHTPDAAAVAATRAAAASLLEAATDPRPPPKRLCVLANADTPSMMDQDLAATCTAPVGDADEPCAKFARTSANSAAEAKQLPTTPSCTADIATFAPAPPTTTRKGKQSDTRATCDAPPAKFPRSFVHAGAADHCLRSAAASSSSSSTCGPATPGDSTACKPAAEPCSPATLAATLALEVPASTTSVPRPAVSSKLGPLSKSTSPLPVTCTARCKPTTRDDLLRQLSSPAASKTGSSCTVSRSRVPAIPPLPVQTTLKRPASRVPFPPEDLFPAKRKRNSNSTSLGEFAPFFK